MVAVPAVTPVTIPDMPIVATAVLLLLHVPPVVVLLNVVVAVAQTIAVPVMVPATGSGLTVTSIVAVAVPQLLVTA